jgi:hypothetical protein
MLTHEIQVRKPFGLWNKFNFPLSFLFISKKVFKNLLLFQKQRIAEDGFTFGALKEKRRRKKKKKEPCKYV